MNIKKKKYRKINYFINGVFLDYFFFNSTIKILRKNPQFIGGHMDKNLIIELVEKIKNSDKDAWETLYEETYKTVYFTINEYISDDYQAREDILQETYVQAYQKLGTLQDPSAFPKWICTIAANKAKNYLKKKKPIYFNELENEEFDEEISFEDENITFQPEASVDMTETIQCVNEMLKQLPKNQQLALALHYGSLLSAREISTIMECSENTAKGYLKYGLNNLRKQKDAMEAKGIKLRTVAFGPFLYWFFRNEMECYAQVSSRHTLDNSSSRDTNTNRDYDKKSIKDENTYTGANGDSTVNPIKGTSGKAVSKKYLCGMITKVFLGLCFIGTIVCAIHFVSEKTEQADFGLTSNQTVSYELKNNAINSEVEGNATSPEGNTEETDDNEIWESEQMTAIGKIFNIGEVYASKISKVKEEYAAEGYDILIRSSSGFKFNQPIKINDEVVITEAEYTCNPDKVYIELPDEIDLPQEEYISLFTNGIFEGAEVEVTFMYWGKAKEISIMNSSNETKYAVYTPIQPKIDIYSIKPLEQSTIDEITKYSESLKRYREEYPSS